MSGAHADAIIATLLSQPEPQGGWSSRALRAASGVRGRDFDAATRSLRYAGKIAWDGFALPASMLAEHAAPPVEPIAAADDVAAHLAEEGRRAGAVASAVMEEAKEASAQRAAARSLGSVCQARGYLSAGAQVQDIALRDSPASAVSIVRDRWSDVWAQVLAHADRNGTRPVIAMVDLIEAGARAVAS